MKILLVAALFACVYAAPSEVVLPAAAPTIDPGDLQAAAIDAQVRVADQMRAFSEATQEYKEKLNEEVKEKAVEAESLIKEKTEEAFWATEDKKWQAVDAVSTASAQLDGALAKSGEALKAAFGGVVIPTYINPQLLPAPIVRSPIVPAAPLYPAPIISAPILPNPAFPPPLIPAPIIYATPGIVEKKEDKKEEKKDEKEIVKSAELEKDKNDESEDKKQDQNLEPSKDVEKPLLKNDKENSEEQLKTPVPILSLVAPLKLPQSPQLAPPTPVFLPQPLAYYPSTYF